MSKPYQPVPDTQQRAFGLALCDRLGLDPAIVGDDLRWEVVGGEELGKVTCTVYLPAQEILDMFNGVRVREGDEAPDIR